MRLALLEDELGSGRGRDGPVEAVPHAPVHVPRVELFERVVKSCVTLQQRRRGSLYVPSI